MTYLRNCALSALAAAMMMGASSAALAESADPVEPLTISGSATITSQYRFRGISLSDEDVAVQAGIDLTHESGFYVGTWGSSLAGFGSFGGGNTEVDVYAGYSTTLGNVTLDGGLLWYLYPGTSGTDYAEVYASVSGDVGPASLTGGVAYAPDQDALGSDDNWYIYGDASFGVPNTPVTLKAHLGYTDGALGFGGNYFDWLIGADLAWRNLTLGVAYVDTDLKGSVVGPAIRRISDSALVVSLTASF